MIKRKKNSRQRGTHTHGWGAKKKHRGAGHRGGRGKAGSGKRGDAKKPSFWGDTTYNNKKGFVSLRKAHKAINISDLEKFEDTKIDLSKQGYDKLLGMGSTSKKYDISVSFASESAIKKIQGTGGTVTLLKKKKEKKTKTQSSTSKPVVASESKVEIVDDIENKSSEEAKEPKKIEEKEEDNTSKPKEE